MMLADIGQGPAMVTRQKAHSMIQWRKLKYVEFSIGLALAFAALIILLDTFGTMVHHIAIGLVTPIIASLLLIILALVGGRS